MTTADKVIAKWGGNPYGQHACYSVQPAFIACKPENMLYHFGIQVTLVELRIRENAQDYEWCDVVTKEIKKYNRMHKKHFPLQVEHTVSV